MRILLDEQLPVKIKYRFDKFFAVSTVRDMNWLGKKDQELFIKIKEEDFKLFITNDQNLKYQVNKNKLFFCFLDLSLPSNRYENLLSAMPMLNKEILKFEQQMSSSSQTTSGIFILTKDGIQHWEDLENRFKK